MKISFRSMVALMRPHQWVKNVFVLVHLGFGHLLHDTATVAHVLLAFVAFCLASSSVYIVNDIFDRGRDRKHPVKRNRPIASGVVAVPAATGFAMALALVALSIGAFVSMIEVAILGAYLLLSLAYSIRLKHTVIADVFVISAGFMLRILAGTLGVGRLPSQWLMICGMMITLFLGFSKRRAEIGNEARGSPNRDHRAVLDVYSGELLDSLVSVTAACSIVSYSLYTMSSDTIRNHAAFIWSVADGGPLVLIGGGSAPRT